MLLTDRFWPVAACRDRQLGVDFGRSSLQRVLVKPHAIGWSIRMQLPGKLGCNSVVKSVLFRNVRDAGRCGCEQYLEVLMDFIGAPGFVLFV